MIEQIDEEAINWLVGDVLNALQLPSVYPLRALVDESVSDDDLDTLQSCWPYGGGLEWADAAEIQAGSGGKASAQFELIVTGGQSDLFHGDWQVERQEDGAWLLAQAPDCPFEDNA